MAASPVVLDAWPLIRYYSDEGPAASAVQHILNPANPIPPIINAVTLGEVYNAVAREEGTRTADRFVASLRRTLRVETVDADHGIQAGWLKTRYHMSLGDSYAAASALHSEAVLWTGDAELLFDGCPWAVNDLRDDSTRQQHEAAITTGAKRVGIRATTAPQATIELPDL